MHKELLGLSDHLLLAIAPTATHQHYKGGLYRELSVAHHKDTGEQVTVYEHLFPYPNKRYVRRVHEFNDKGRFRPLVKS